MGAVATTHDVLAKLNELKEAEGLTEKAAEKKNEEDEDEDPIEEDELDNLNESEIEDDDYMQASVLHSAVHVTHLQQVQAEDEHRTCPNMYFSLDGYNIALLRLPMMPFTDYHMLIHEHTLLLLLRDASLAVRRSRLPTAAAELALARAQGREYDDDEGYEEDAGGEGDDEPIY